MLRFVQQRTVHSNTNRMIGLAHRGGILASSSSSSSSSSSLARCCACNASIAPDQSRFLSTSSSGSRTPSAASTLASSSSSTSPPLPKKPIPADPEDRTPFFTRHIRVKNTNTPIPAFITTKDLSVLLRFQMSELTKLGKKLFQHWWPTMTKRAMKKGGMVEVKEIILSFQDAAKIVEKRGRTAVPLDFAAEEATLAAKRPLGPPLIAKRPCVVSILGHKDHGKTTLLDKLRGGNIAAREEYGITQETYAFHVDITDPTKPDSAPQMFSFLDTPGHVSFTEMRSYVAEASDLIVLVVAVDEGVLDQTFETLRTARQLNRPLIVVINKIDLPGSAEKVRQIKEHLVELGATLHPPSQPVVSLKGDLVVVELSALHDKTELAELRRTLIRVTNQLKPRYDKNHAYPYGKVIESFVGRGRGNVVRVVMQNGTLKHGDGFVAGEICEGRVKEIRGMKRGGRGADGQDGEAMQQVGAGVTVDLVGCSSLPQPGTEIRVISSYERAELIARTRRYELQYEDQQRVIMEKLKSPDHDLQQIEASNRGDSNRRALEEEDEEEYDEIEEVDEIEEADENYNDDGEEEEEMISADEVSVDLDPRSHVAPPLPPKSQWELSPPPPPTQRALPIANFRPTFKFYTLKPDIEEENTDSHSRLAGTQIQSPPQQVEGSAKRFGLNILLKTTTMGSLSMLRHAIDEMNAKNVEKGLPEIHVAYGAATDLISKSDLTNAEAEGCWCYGFRVPRPDKTTIQRARSRRVPLFLFRHHQHLLDHLQHHIEMSPQLTESGETKLEDGNAQPARRSHYTVQ